MARQTINMTALVNANSKLIERNASLESEVSRLGQELDDAQTRIRDLEEGRRRFPDRSAPGLKLSSLTGRVNPRSEMPLVGLPSFEMSLGNTKSKMRFLCKDAAVADEIRSLDRARVVSIPCEARKQGMTAIGVGTIFAEFVIEKQEPIRAEGDDNEKTVKTYAVDEAGDRIKILSIPEDGLAAARLGERVRLEGVYRSYKVKDKYWPFFITEAKLGLELDRLNGVHVNVGEDYVPDRDEDVPDIAF